MSPPLGRLDSLVCLDALLARRSTLLRMVLLGLGHHRFSAGRGACDPHTVKHVSLAVTLEHDFGLGGVLRRLDVLHLEGHPGVTTCQRENVRTVEVGLDCVAARWNPGVADREWKRGGKFHGPRDLGARGVNADRNNKYACNDDGTNQSSHLCLLVLERGSVEPFERGPPSNRYVTGQGTCPQHRRGTRGI